MKYISEYRDASGVQNLAAVIRRLTTRKWTIMEVCGGQTHTIMKFALDQLLPRDIELVHGPGCPVCVTPLELIDKAVKIAEMPGVVLCSYGDMLRVPGSEKDLFSAKASGADVRALYSPLDCLTIAQRNPDKQVVFFAVGFETSVPAHAMTLHLAKQRNIKNFSMIVSHVLVPPAMKAILGLGQCNVQGFLAAGNVCAIMGTNEYLPIAQQFKVPIVVTGFEPIDVLQGIAMCVAQLERGEARVENQYSRNVKAPGNTIALDLIRRVFRVVNRKWRGIGELTDSGLSLSDEYRDFDAEARFGVADVTAHESQECIAGAIMQGLARPNDCTAFCTRCTPEKPLGASMVSAEGVCAAYYRYSNARGRSSVS